MRAFAAILGACVLTGAGLRASAAAAQEPGTLDRQTLAESLFDEGRRLVVAGRFAEGCEKFVTSERLDHAVGTLLNLADCYERAGKLASAWTTYRLAAASAAEASQPERENVARQREADLVTRLPRMRVRVPLPARTRGLEVRLDGVRIEPAAWGIAVPVDAGPHTLAASAPEHVAWSRVVDVAPRRADHEETIPELAVDPDAGRFDVRRPLGIGLIGAGAAGVVVGGVFGIRALVLNGETSGVCSGDRCNAAGVDERNSARTSGDISTVAFAAGAAAAGAGVLLLLTSGSSASRVGAASTLRVGANAAPGGGALVLSGAF
jgi:serine/threonine-protein kinase